MIEFFESGKVSIACDLFWGSSAKGAISPHMIKHDNGLLAAIATPNQPSAGHTTILRPDEYTGKVVEGNPAFSILEDGSYKITLKCLPSATFVTANIPILLTCDAGFKLDRLLAELELVNDQKRVMIHPLAIVVTDEHKKGAEQTGRHLSGTMQGGGHAAAEKMLRKPGVKLAKDYPEIAKFIGNTSEVIQNAVFNGKAVLLELPQGFSLSLNHGFSYPYLTSRDITPAFAMNTCGVSPKHIGKVIGNVRPFPIRVGSIENSTSGGCYDGQRELNWDLITKFSGADRFGVEIKEHTTVTGRVRRCFTFSPKQLQQAIRYCEPDFLALTFTSQIDYRSFGAKKLSDIPEEALIKVAEFTAMLEFHSGVKVAVLGTGPKNDEQLDVLEDEHFQQLVSEAKNNGRHNLILAEIDRKIAELENGYIK